MKPILLAGAVLLVATAAGLALRVHQGADPNSQQHVALFVLILAVSAAAFLAACLSVSRGPDPRALAAILGVAITLRALVLTAPPFLSSDLYRYVWDGTVARAGINPYRYVPADPALARLRDDTIYPHVNRRDYAPTIYPPTAQLVFRAVASLSRTTLAFRLAAIAFEALGIACLLLLLDQTAQPLSRILIYAWNPLAVWAYAGNGHVDALAIGLIPLALLLRAARRDAATGVALGAAILVKFLPLAIAPALWRVPRLRMPLACAATILLLYGLYASAGGRVFGFLGAYSGEEHITSGSGIWLLAGLGHLVTLPPAASRLYLLAAAVVLAALAFRGLRRDAGIQSVARQAGLLAAATTVAISPHYPWYFPYLGLFSVLAPSLALTWLSTAPLLLYLDPLHGFFAWPSLVYVPAILLAVIDHRHLRRSP